MKYKKLFLITIILLVTLSLSAVSAADNITNENVVIDNTQQNTLQIDNTTHSSIESSDLEKYYLNDSQFEVKFLDKDGNPLANTNVSFEIQGGIYNRITNENGTAVMVINLRPGQFDITSINPVTNESAVNKITVLSTISGDNLNKYYKGNEEYKATFVDGAGNPLTNTEVSFNIDGVFYKRTTDKNGVASMAINLRPGNYIITAINPFNNQQFSNNVTVLSTVNGSNVVKYYKNGTQYEAKFIDGNGNPLVNKQVTFNIDGVMYKRFTNENGTAVMVINLRPGTFIITAINPVNGELSSNNITVLSTVNGSNVVKYYKNGTQYEAKFIDGNGNPVANETVTFNIDGVMYKRVTDENGTAVMVINLRPGTFIITAINPVNGELSSNNITVLSRLIVSDTKVDFNKSGKYTVKYVDETGKPIANATINLNIDGVVYKRVTDENGTATMTINLRPGEYTVTASCEDSIISSKLTVNKMRANLKIINSTIKKNSYLQVKVTDDRTGNGIAGIPVIFGYNNMYWGVYADSNGLASIKVALDPGSYQMIIAIQNHQYYQNIATYTTIKVI